MKKKTIDNFNLINTKSVLRNQLIRASVNGFCFFLLLAMTFSALSLAMLSLYLALVIFAPLLIIIPATVLLFGSAVILSAASAYLFVLTIDSLFGFKCKNIKNNLALIQQSINDKKLKIALAKSSIARRLAFVSQLQNVDINDDDEDEEDFNYLLKKNLFKLSQEINSLIKYIESNKNILENQYKNIANQDLFTAKIYNKTYSEITDASNYVDETKNYILKYLSNFYQIKNEGICLVHNIDYVIQDKLSTYQSAIQNDSPLLVNNESIEY